MEAQRICMECGQRIVGRTDKKFCNDHCRVAWHNKRGTASSYVKNVNGILRRNRKILAGLRASGTTKVAPVALEQLGFEFNYFTNVKRSRRGVLHYCYEQGYVRLQREIRLLAHRSYRSHRF